MRPLLLGCSIIIMTDDCPLCHIITKTVNNARVDRIANLIQEYNIEQVIHISGRHNCLPDYLSRYPREQDDELFDVEYGFKSKNAAHQVTYPTNQLLASMVLRLRKNEHVTIEAVKDIHLAASTENNSFPTSHTADQSNTSIPRNFSSNHFKIMELKDEQKKDSQI